MQGRPPSRTALGAPVHRAVHQRLEGGKIFADPHWRIDSSDGARSIATFCIMATGCLSARQRRPYANARHPRLQLLGEEAHAIIAETGADATQRPMRLFIAARSRFAEDCLSAAVSRGVRQAVVRGADLDTFSLRNPHAPLGLHVFEVDYPATQAWKRERLMREGLAIPASLTFAPVDFAQQSR